METLHRQGPRLSSWHVPDQSTEHPDQQNRGQDKQLVAGGGSVCLLQGRWDKQKNPSTEILNLLYKPESVLNDMVMMDCLGLLHSILEDSNNKQWLVNIIWYSVVPVTESSGLVAMVPRCKTLQGIAHKNKTTLLNYLLDRNSESNVHDIRSSFVRSCAICSIQSMVFGLGTATENIPMTDGGCMFHVDYSYLLVASLHMKTWVPIRGTR